MHRGYVKVWRKLTDSGILQDQGACQFFLWAMLKAAHRSRKQLVGNRVVELESGQFVSGRHAASEELGISEMMFRGIVKKMQRLGFVTTKPTNKFTVFTIINWDRYQAEQPPVNQQVSQQRTNSEPTANQQRTTNKNIKNLNIKESLEESPEPPAASGPSSPVVFTFPTVGKVKSSPIYQHDIDSWEELFPALDVSQVVRECLAWNDANPARRKTPGGLRRHIVGWLTREQNNGRGGPGKQVGNPEADFDRQLAEFRALQAKETCQ